MVLRPALRPTLRPALLFAAAPLFAVVLAAPCATRLAAQATDPLPDSPGTASHAVTPALPTGPTVLMDTSMGRIACQLYTKEAPLTTANFIALANGTRDWTDPVTQQKMHNKRFYDGTTFHRVIPGFMAQGGDRAGNGTGDAGYFIDNETTPALTFDVPGRLAMANSGPNTNGTQFFVTEQAYPSLNGNYTIFGQCDPHAVAVVTSITHVDRDSSDKPFTPVILNKVTVVPVGGVIPADPTPSLPAATPVAPAAVPPPSPTAR